MRGSFVVTVHTMALCCVLCRLFQSRRRMQSMMVEECRVDPKAYGSFARLLEPMVAFLDDAEMKHLLQQLSILINNNETRDANDKRQEKLMFGRFCIYEFKRIISERIEHSDDNVAIRAFTFERKSLPAILEMIDRERKRH